MGERRGFLTGAKTYILAGVLVLHGLSGYFLGEVEAMEAIRSVIEGLGLAALRKGISG